MTTVTYKNQPGIHKTRGAVGNQGTDYVYTVRAVLWPEAVEEWILSRIVGSSLHVCCGKSSLGDVRVDLFEAVVDVRADAARLPFAGRTFDTVLCDPPYNGKFQWNHDMLNELHRVARRRIIFQHWFSPCDRNGRFKKCHDFARSEAAIAPVMDDRVFDMSDLVAWNPRSYFGRVQLITVMDCMDK